MRDWQQRALSKIDRMGAASDIYMSDGIPPVTVIATDCARRLVEYADIPVSSWKVSTNETGCYEIEINTMARDYCFIVLPSGHCAYHYYDSNRGMHEGEGSGHLSSVTKLAVRVVLAEWHKGGGGEHSGH